MPSNRQEIELPVVINQGWQYHHLGIPTDIVHPNERYLKDLKMYVSGFETSPYGIEWMRFEEDSPISKIIPIIPHTAFEVDDLDMALEGKKKIGEISTPSSGNRIAVCLSKSLNELRWCSVMPCFAIASRCILVG